MTEENESGSDAILSESTALAPRASEDLFYQKERKKNDMRKWTLLGVSVVFADIVVDYLAELLLGSGTHLPILTSGLVIVGIWKGVVVPISSWSEARSANIPRTWKNKKDEVIIAWAWRSIEALKSVMASLGIHHESVPFEQTVSELQGRLKRWRSILETIAIAQKEQAVYGNAPPDAMTASYEKLESERSHEEQKIQDILDCFSIIKLRLLTRNHERTTVAQSESAAERLEFAAELSAEECEALEEKLGLEIDSDLQLIQAIDAAVKASEKPDAA